MFFIVNYVDVVAEGLKKHCDKWGHDWLQKLKNDSSIKNFRKLFFNVSHLYYVHDQDDFYNVTFDKKEDIATVKRCGKDWDERDIDATIDVEEIIRLLVL